MIDIRKKRQVNFNYRIFFKWTDVSRKTALKAIASSDQTTAIAKLPKSLME